MQQHFCSLACGKRSVARCFLEGESGLAPDGAAVCPVDACEESFSFDVLPVLLTVSTAYAMQVTSYAFAAVNQRPAADELLAAFLVRNATIFSPNLTFSLVATWP